MADGIEIRRSQTGDELESIVTPDGQVRFLAAIPDPTMMRVAPKFSDVIPLIPRSSIKPKSRRFTSVPIRNQGQLGSCNPHGATSAQMLARAAQGMTFDLLSACFVYALINGGRDQGSSPSDAMTTLINTGACLETEFPEGNYQASKIPQSAYTTAKRFQVDTSEQYTFDSYDEFLTGVALDFYAFFTVRAGGAWSNVGSDGKVPVLYGQPNHVICAGEDIALASNGDLVLPSRNSWDTTWGAGGYGTITEAHVEAQRGNFTGYFIKAAKVDPSDPTNPIPVRTA